MMCICVFVLIIRVCVVSVSRDVIILKYKKSLFEINLTTLVHNNSDAI